MDPSSRRLPWYVATVPVALIVAGAVGDALTPTEYAGDALLSAGVMVTGALFSLRRTIAAGAAMVLIEVVLTIRDGYFGRPVGTRTLINVVLIALVGVGVNRVVAHYGRRLERVRSVAEAAQRAVLPQPPARIGPLTVAAVYHAAEVEAQIGGDAYAVQDTPYGTRLLIADVRGKGMGAVGVVSVLLGTFRVEADRAPDLTALAGALEHALLKEGSHREEAVRTEGFVTALLGEITPGADRVRLLNCGHPAPYLLRGSAVCALDPADPGLPLGMSGLGVPRPQPDTWPFPPGGTLLLITDGVTEARNRSGQFYEPAAGLGGRGPFRRPDQAIDALLRDVEHWTGGPRDDDMAILAITRSAGEPYGG
ncbi:PP2C family protein-serine/threonine phosphatase [Streptomyces sp. YGL11-2]|uniref:PP2C family protein-serine/threonine phosphatase n=1 Tax=Streptomyces sp. YGL11-2 TaxID=3414028 RepID=UPI003CF9D15F